MGIASKPQHPGSLIEFRTSQIRPLKAMFDSIKNKLPNTSLLFSPTVLQIQQLDGVHAFVVNARLDGENFEHYYCVDRDPDSQQAVDVEHPIIINLAAKLLNSVFRNVTKNDQVLHFRYAGNEDNAYVTLTIMKTNSAIRVYRIPIQDPEDEDPMAALGDDYQANSKCILTLPSDTLVRICKEFKTHECTKLQIKYDGDQLYFSTKGLIEATAIEGNGIEVVKPTVAGEIYCKTYKFNMVHDFSKTASGDEEKRVTMILDESALVLEYEIGTLGKMTIAISPMTAEAENDE